MSATQSTPARAVEYREVPGEPGYRVGDDGTVWTQWIRGSNPARLGTDWKPMTAHRHRDGHLFVQLRGRRHVFVHQLVLEAFVGPRPPGMQARHFPDRNPANNYLWNLSWATALVNQRDRFVHGTHCRGLRCYAAKLTAEQVRAARAEYEAGGITQRQLAKKYGIAQGPLWKILHRQSYVDVE